MKKIRKGGAQSSYSGERFLLMVLLAVAFGTFLFSFFLSSRDVKGAQAMTNWTQSLDQILDKIVEDLGNAAQIEHPFDGVSKQCLFRRLIQNGSMEPSLETEGFLFTESGLFHMVKDAAGGNVLKPYLELANPLVGNIQMGQFERPGPRILRLVLQVKMPEQPDQVKQFERTVFLKNL